MRRLKFSESQIVAILKEVEARVAVAEVIRKAGISRATFFTWRAKYGGATVAELKRLKELEHENAMHKKMFADLALVNAATKEVLRRTL